MSTNLTETSLFATIHDLINTTTATTAADDTANGTEAEVAPLYHFPPTVPSVAAAAIILLALCLPAAVANLLNAVFLYKRRPLSARHLALLGSSGKRAPQELLLLNLSVNNVFISLVCFSITGAGSLCSAYQYGSALKSIILTMLLEYITSSLLSVRITLLMLIVLERAHSSWHSRQHGMLQEQIFFHRSVCIAWAVNVAFALFDCVLKYDHTLGASRVEHFNYYYSQYDIDSNVSTFSNTTIKCFTFSRSIVWWNWLTSAARYALPTLVCLVLGAMAVTNYFRALRAAVRAITMNKKKSKPDATTTRVPIATGRKVGGGVANTTTPIRYFSNMSATVHALQEKRARVWRASLKLGLFVLASAAYSVLLLTAEHFVVIGSHDETNTSRLVLSDEDENDNYAHSAQNSSSGDGDGNHHVHHGLIDCRAIGVPNYTMTPQAPADSIVSHLLTFFMLLTTLIDPVAVGLSYTMPSLESVHQHQQLQQHQQNHQAAAPVAGKGLLRLRAAPAPPTLPFLALPPGAGGAPHQQHQYQHHAPQPMRPQRSAVGELLYRTYRLVLRPTAAWLHLLLYIPLQRALRVLVHVICPSAVLRVLHVMPRKRQARQTLLLAENKKQQQEYQNMMHFLSAGPLPRPNLLNNYHHHQHHVAPQLFHIAVQQQQRLHVQTQHHHFHHHQRGTVDGGGRQKSNSTENILHQAKSGQILLTIENYINVSSQPSGGGGGESKSVVTKKTTKKRFKVPPPQQLKLLMPNNASDIGDVLRPGTGATSSAVVVVEQVPKTMKIRTTTKTTMSASSSAGAVSTASASSKFTVHVVNNFARRNEEDAEEEVPDERPVRKSHNNKTHNQKKSAATPAAATAASPFAVQHAAYDDEEVYTNNYSISAVPFFEPTTSGVPPQPPPLNTPRLPSLNSSY